MLRQLLSGGIGRALRYPQYRRFVSGDVISLIGTWVQRVAIGWLTWELTESGAWLGIVAFSELAPSLLFSPIGGAFADRFDRRRLAMTAELLLMGQSFAFVLLVFTGWIDIWWVVALMVLRGCLNSWSHPARQAIIASLVPREELATAVAMNSVLFNLARFVGPALAGLLIVQGGIGYAFLFNALSFLVFIYALWTLKPMHPDALADKRKRLGGQMIEGYVYVARHPGIGPLILLLLVTAVFGRPIAELLPGFAGAVFENGASGLAWMTSAMGVGAAIGGLWIAQRGRVNGLTQVIVWTTFLIGASLLGFVAVSWFPAAVFMLGLAGFATATMSICCQSLIQTAVDGQLRGRVVSVYGMIFRMGPALGALIMGWLSEGFGWLVPVAAGAAVTLIMAVWALKRRDFIREVMEKPAQERATAG